MTPLELFGTWRLAAPAWLHLGWLAMVLPLVVAWGVRRRAAAVRRFASDERLDELVGRSRLWPTAARAVAASAACLLLAVVMARPQSDPVEVESRQTGRSVVFLLDVSRSMLATDVAPTRLGRAKLWIGDLVSELRGDRFGLVAFAGTSTIACPLTADREFFRMALEEVTPDTVARGGTNIGDAIRKTTELLLPEAGSDSGRVLHDLVLITDGEDQESLPVEAARAAAQRGVRVIALGIGSKEGVSIEADGAGESVRTRLESGTLAEIARSTPGGVYLEVGTGTVDLARLYRDLIASAEQDELGTATSLKYTERFAWFLWPVVVLLLGERVLIPHSARRAAW